MSLIFIYVTTAQQNEAKKIARHLLNDKLIACANIFPIESMYVWEGKIRDEAEYVLLLKTHQKNYTKITKEIEKMHSYKTACITKINVSPNKKYAKWLNGQL
jgi:periplasmic divalent cation tolerance protein